MRNKISGVLREVAICVGLIVVVLVAFGQSSHFRFVNYDDPNYVYENPLVLQGLSGRGIIWAFTHVHGGNWHPLTTISHMLDCELFGLRAGAHHLVNVLLHALTALGLFVSLRLLSGSVWRSAFVAAVFAVHPLRVESVIWIAERKDVLSGLLFMLTLLAYVWYARQRSIGRYLAMSILFLCGLMSKPMLVTTPLILLLLDYWPLKRLTDFNALKTLLREKLPLFALSLFSSVVTLVAQKPALGSLDQLPLSWRLGNAALACLTYVRQMFWPAKLAVFYPHSDNTLPLSRIVLGVAALGAITVSAIVVRKKRPWLLVGWLWYLCMLIPVIGIVQVGLQGHADRYTYLPQIGLYIAITWFMSESIATWRHASTTLASAAIVVIVTLVCTSRVQASYWRDSELLWKQAIANTSDNHLAHAHLADLLLRQGRIEEAIFHCQEAIRIRPTDADAQNNLGLALLQIGDVSRAVAHFEKTLEINPSHLNAEVNLAWVLATSSDDSMRNGARAVQLTEDVVKRASHSNAIVLRTLAAAYAETGRFNDAIATAQQAIAIARSTSNEGLISDLERSIAAYRSNQPIRSGP